MTCSPRPGCTDLSMCAAVGLDCGCPHHWAQEGLEIACQGVGHLSITSCHSFKVLDIRRWLCSGVGVGVGTSASSKWGVPWERKLLPTIEYKRWVLELSWKQLSRIG